MIPAARWERTGKRRDAASAYRAAVGDRPAVVLRTRTDADLDLLFRLAADLDTWEERSPSGPAPLSRPEFDAQLARRDAEGAPETVRFVIEADGEAVGGTSLFAFDALAHHAELGIGLAPEARGRGIGTAALELLVEFAFERRNLRRLHLEAIASNAAAIRSYEKVGFVVEGRQREHAWVRGRYEDVVRMGLLRSEWTARRQG